MRVAVYPGTFDPITFGHIDVIERALQVFDRVVVGIITTPQKKPLFSLEHRVEMVEKSLNHLKQVKVRQFNSLTVDLAKEENAIAIIRGLREVSDFAEEFTLATMNRKLNSEIETVMFVTSKKYFYLSSGIIKEIAHYGGDISEFVPKHVEKKLKEKLG